MSAEEKSEALEIRSTIEKVTPKRRPARKPKHVEACNVSKDTSNLTISSKKVLKQKNVKLNRENKKFKKQNKEIQSATHALKRELCMLKSKISNKDNETKE